MKSFDFTVGIFLCGKVRNFLKKCKFKGMDIEWIETSGWIEREFIVKGNDKDIDVVRKSIYDWAKEFNEVSEEKSKVKPN